MTGEVDRNFSRQELIDQRKGLLRQLAQRAREGEFHPDDIEVFASRYIGDIIWVEGQPEPIAAETWNRYLASDSRKITLDK